MKINYALAIGYIGLIVGMAWSDVGEARPCGGVYEWNLPFIVLLITGIPAFLVWLGGRKSN